MPSGRPLTLIGVRRYLWT